MKHADLLLINGKIVTVDSAFRTASAVAIGDGHFIVVGTDEEALRHAGELTHIVDLKGKTVLPGFIDAHVHAAGIGLQSLKRFVQFDQARCIDDMLEAIGEKAAETPRGEWIIGSGEVQFDLIGEGRLPYRWELDKVTLHHPFFMRVRGHLGATNSKALEALGIAKDTPDPPGGLIFRDSLTGELTGWLLDNAVYNLVLPSLPKVTVDEWLEGVEAINRRYNSFGVTGIINQAGDVLDVLEELRRRNKLTVRWQANLKGSSNYFDRPLDAIPQTVRELGHPTGYGNEWVKVGAIGELHSDGLIEGALMYKPFAEEYLGRGWQGLLRHDRDTLRSICLAAAESGFQMEVHASGDAAMDLVLDVYEEVDRKIPLIGKRWIITHGGVFPSQNHVKRVQRLGAIVSTQQAVHWLQSRYYRKFWGDSKGANLFANRTWLDAGVMVAGGGDVVLPPLLGIYTCVSRRNFFGEVLELEEAIKREEAIKLYTINGAYASFEENLKGSIEPGKFADLVVLSDNPLTIPEERIKDIDVLMTIVGGKIVYDRCGTAQ